MARPDPKKLRAEALDLVERGKLKKAIEVYRALEMAEPGEGSHPHKLGELQQREGDSISALAALVRASEKYARAGFLVKAIAVCKLILRIEPEHREAQERVAALNKARTHAAVPQDAGAASRALSAGRSLTGVPLAALSATATIAIAPGIDEIELDDDVELEDDDAGLSPADRARVKSALAETPFVAVLGEAALARLIAAARLIDLATDEVLFRQGDPGDALYVVESGEVVALAENPRRALARLGDGAVFGEMALLTDQPRSATIAAASPTRLVAFDRKAVGDTLALEPRATSVLVGFLRRRLVANLIASSPLFAPFPPEDRRALASRFRLSEASDGAVLVKQGERARGLYVVLAGSADVVREGGDPVARLGAGDVFGEISLLEGAAVATVRARERSLLLVLPAVEFREIIMTHPHVLEVVTALADDRKRAAAPQPGAGTVDLGFDLHLDL